MPTQKAVWAERELARQLRVEGRLCQYARTSASAYHHLFQELLRAELEHTEPGLAPRLLGHAREWCAANGELETAFGYAQEAGDVDRAAKLFKE
jgi:hypothetical protein